MGRSGWKAGEGDVKVLVVEDNERTLAAIIEELVAAGYLVSWARNGQEALEKAFHQPLDLIITDDEMPVMNGGELIKMVRERHPRLPIILMPGGYQALEGMERIERLWLLPKPFTFEALRSSMEEALREEGQARSV